MSPTRTALAVSICAALGAPAYGATFNVTSNADSGAGSLREALSLAGANAEADVIELSAISGDTIMLSSGQLVVDTDSITINGADVTIEGDGAERVLSAQYSDVTLNDLTITGGQDEYGGGIEAKYSDLTLNNCVVSGNTAASVGGGIAASGYYGELQLNDTLITGNSARDGGGVFFYTYDDAVTLNRSVITGNSAVLPANEQPDPGTPLAAKIRERMETSLILPSRLRGDMAPPTGGGVALTSYFGDVTINDSTISGNQASQGGGLVAATGYGNVIVSGSTISGNSAEFAGGGVLRSQYELTLRNSTVSGNSSTNIIGGVAMYGDNPLGKRGVGIPLTQVAFSTIAGNDSADIGGIGFSTYTEASVFGSVISGNTAVTDPDVGFEPGSAAQATLESSLLGIDSTSGTLTLDPVSTTLLGQDPLLGPLADNGGFTFTHLPGAGSPLIDVIPDGELECGLGFNVDQRGEPRPSAAGCDLGSVEIVAGQPPIPESIPVPTLDRFGLWLMAGLMGLAGLVGFRRRRVGRGAG